MRSIRALMAAAAVVVALPSLSGAQEGRQFKDAWFWGIKGGGYSFANTSQAYTAAPLAGIDWLITRTHGGLYVSASEAFFNQNAIIINGPTLADTGVRIVDLKNLRRLDMAAVGFPGEHLHLHPYVGIGFTLNEIASAVAEGPFTQTNQRDFAEAVINDAKVGFSPMLLLGAQYRLRRVSAFVQGQASPAQRGFIMYNGRPFNFTYEIGLRYNAGTSIDRD